MSIVPAFHIRHIPIYGDLILAPMDGYSDLPFRLICRELGGAVSYTEFVNVDELQSRKPTVKAWQKLKFHPAERPMTFQIYGHDEDWLVETSVRLQELDPDIIDINMGCCVKDIAGRGRGLRIPLLTATTVNEFDFFIGGLEVGGWKHAPIQQL